MADYAEELKLAKAIARKAGEVMLRYFDADQQVERKSDGSPVTVADKEINAMVIAEIKKAFPEDGVIAEEESTCDYGMGRIWICDPIDGTNAFTWGVPTAMFSLGLVVDGEVNVGVAYDPFIDRLFWAQQGSGSFVNDRKLAVSPGNLKGGTVAISGSVSRLIERKEYVEAIKEEGAFLAMFSGAVYKACMVGSGRFVGYGESFVNPHDVVAVDLIVREAGGKVTGMDGKPLNYAKHFNGAIISNGVVHDWMVKHIP